MGINTDGKKTLYAAALLEGTAAGGVFAGIERVTSNSTDSATWPWKTANEFMTHLARKYATLDLAADAENKLRTLAQKDDFAAFTDFLTEFTNLTDPKDPDAMDVDTIRANLTRIPEEEKLRRMNDGLCFNCGQAGHLARKSRNPTNKGQQGNRGGRAGQYRQRDGYGGYSEGYYGQGQGGLCNFSANNSYQQHWQAQAAPRGGNFNTNAGYGNHGAPARRGGMRGVCAASFSVP
ncbi:hypothetical protein MFIFM68171_02248 [Madurella fahalii]|uniref:CCHC-type domain-containing protein n=1 Tax=Madurella fahalii TaxID=1157608 RepID=A0ABQ0G2P7_9PEZI